MGALLPGRSGVHVFNTHQSGAICDSSERNIHKTRPRQRSENTRGSSICGREGGGEHGLERVVCIRREWQAQEKACAQSRAAGGAFLEGPACAVGRRGGRSRRVPRPAWGLRAVERAGFRRRGKIRITAFFTPQTLPAASQRQALRSSDGETAESAASLPSMGFLSGAGGGTDTGKSGPQGYVPQRARKDTGEPGGGAPGPAGCVTDASWKRCCLSRDPGDE